MVNGLQLYCAFSSQMIHITFSRSTIHGHIHTLLVVSYVLVTAAPRQTNRSEAAKQLVSPGTLTTTNRKVKCLSQGHNH